MKLTFFCSTFAAIAGIAIAQQSTLYVPQVADGGGWQTTFVLTNRTANPAAASLSFRSDFTAGSTSTWTPSFVEVSSTSNIVVSAASTILSPHNRNGGRTHARICGGQRGRGDRAARHFLVHEGTWRHATRDFDRIGHCYAYIGAVR